MVDQHRSHPGADADRIANESLPEQVANRLSHAILNGEFPPGARLPEPEIAERFGVSRGPVREAFHMLAREGLVQFRPRRGVIVTDLTPEQTHEIYELRAVLFAHACRLAAKRATPEALANARKALAALGGAAARGAKLAEFLRARAELISIVYLSAGNATLIEETERLNRRAFLLFAVFDREERRAESVTLWTRVVEALEARDGRKAAAAGEAMVEASEQEVMRLMHDRQDRPA